MPSHAYAEPDAFPGTPQVFAVQAEWPQPEPRGPEARVDAEPSTHPSWQLAEAPGAAQQSASQLRMTQPGPDSTGATSRSAKEQAEWRMAEQRNAENRAAEQRLVDQLHTLYAEKERLEVAIGLSDGDDITRHVLAMRREQQAIRSDVEAAMAILRSVTARLERWS
jgi:hypothetical protein